MTEHTGGRNAEGRRFCLLVSRFNRMATERLKEGAHSTLIEHGADPEAIDLVEVPGAWELPWAARRILDRGGHDGLVAVGCVIRGETPHFEYICEVAMRELGRLAAAGEVPMGLGLLTCDTLQQALERSGGEAGNKGREAALATLELCGLAEQLPAES